MISVVINTLNEADDLPKVIKSVKDLADEIIVVDMESTDGTPEVAKNLGAKVFNHKRFDYVEPARNFGISKAISEWVLVIDVDEELPSSLARKIKDIISSPEADYYRLPRKNIIFGKWIENTLWWPDYQIRLFKKGSVSWNQIIHGVPMTEGVGFDLPIQEKFAIVHHNYDSIEQYVQKLNRYTSVQAKLSNDKFDWRDLFAKPTNEFINRYFTGKGYKDGTHGLALSLLQAFSELVLVVKIWQKEKFTEHNLNLDEVVSQMKNKEKDLHYWQANTKYKETGKIVDRIKRKLKI